MPRTRKHKANNAKHCETDKRGGSRLDSRDSSKSSPLLVPSRGTGDTLPGGLGGRIKPLPARVIDGHGEDVDSSSKSSMEGAVRESDEREQGSLSSSLKTAQASDDRPEGASPQEQSSDSDDKSKIAIEGPSSAQEARESEGGQGSSDSASDDSRTSLAESSAISEAPKKGPKRGGGKRVSRAEVLLRVRIVEGLMLRGFLGRDVQLALESQFKKSVPWTTVQKYIRYVAKLWEDEDALMRPYRRARQLRQLHDAADQLMQNESWKEWIEVQRLIARLEGNEAKQEQEETVRTKFQGWSVEELKAYARDRTIPKRLTTGQTSREESLLLGEGAGEGPTV